VEIIVLDQPEGNVLARGSYFGGPSYEFVVGTDRAVYFQVAGETEKLWAGPSPESFRRIAAAFQRYQVEVRGLASEDAQLEAVSRMRRELHALGALPSGLPPYPKPFWSLMVFEAGHGPG
jgi:hypothetical protein